MLGIVKKYPAYLIDGIIINYNGKESKMEILRTENLKKYYDQNMVCVKALDGVDLSVEQGEFVAIVGTSEAESPHFCICWEDLTALQQVRCW